MRRFLLPELTFVLCGCGKGRWLFSTLLLAQRPIFCLSRFPESSIAAPYERRPSVVIASTDPCRFSAFLMKARTSFFQRFGDVTLEDFTLLVGRPPQVVNLAADFVCAALRVTYISSRCQFQCLKRRRRETGSHRMSAECKVPNWFYPKCTASWQKRKELVDLQGLGMHLS